MTYKEARQRILAYLNADKMDAFAVYEPAIECEFGWIFSYNLKEAISPTLSSKIEQRKAQGHTYAEIEAILTPKDLEQDKLEAGLVGNMPVFVDKETGAIEVLSGTRIHESVLIEEIQERKTGQSCIWGVYLQEDLQGNYHKQSLLRKLLHLSASEVIALLKQPDTPIFIGSIRDVWYVHQALINSGLMTNYRKIAN